jgi:hypothetical protein
MKLFTSITAYLQSFVLFSTVLLLGSCAPRYAAYVSQYKVPAADSHPNYNDLYYWAAHPAKTDPSDSIPASIADRSRDTLVDVFFIHPTTYTRSKEGWNADIHDAALNAKTDYSPILYQASVFNQHARIFAPRYRQAHISAFFVDSRESAPVFELAYEDIKRSFQHYLQEYNYGRPIIIAGHSQGGLMAEQLLREFFDGKPMQSQLVAAYVIGWPVPQNYFQELRVCTTPQQTGCFCSWRTFQEGYRPAYVEKETPPAVVTNPLNWSADETYVAREANKGSVLRDFNEVVPHTTGARVYGGVLWSKKPKFPGSALFVTRNYHVGDINLFYMNLRENVEQRIKAFLGGKELGILGAGISN